MDADDARLKNEMKEIFEDELSNNTSFKHVSNTIEKLDKQGYRAQVNPREINLFLLKENERVRIESAVQLETSNLNPETLSPNVVTRPLYQQKILPNLAYVGGPGEIAYWLEYKEMFDHYKVNFPILVPRNFVMLIDAHVGDKLGKLGLEAEDVWRRRQFRPRSEQTAHKNCQTRAFKVSNRALLQIRKGRYMKQFNGIVGSGGRDRTGDLRIMIPPL